MSHKYLHQILSELSPFLSIFFFRKMLPHNNEPEEKYFRLMLH